MNKKQELHKLKMKYFWEQKFLEVSKFIGIIALVIGGAGFLPYWIGKLVYHLYPSFVIWFMETKVIEIFDYWIIGLLTLLISFCTVVSFLLIYCKIDDWVEANLEKAEKRARSELKMKMKVANKLSSQRRMKGGKK